MLDTKFVSEVMCLEWLANMVLVKKVNGKMRVCINFTNLNKVYPSDSYPLSHINQLVDFTASHELLSFLDGYLSYHWIFMANEGKEKISFITDQKLITIMLCHLA